MSALGHERTFCSVIAPLMQYPSTHARQELSLEYRFIELERETRFGRVRHQHVDASGTPIDNG
jgi:hypothetical protein